MQLFLMFEEQLWKLLSLKQTLFPALLFQTILLHLINKLIIFKLVYVWLLLDPATIQKIIIDGYFRFDFGEKKRQSLGTILNLCGY